MLKSKLWVIELNEEPEIIIMGKKCYQRRNVGFFSNESTGYKYSGQISKSIPLNKSPILEWILPQINLALNTNFNGILVNSYKNGEKYIGAHSDDENGLDNNCLKTVVSIAYGTTRLFRIRDSFRFST